MLALVYARACTRNEATSTLASNAGVHQTRATNEFVVHCADELIAAASRDSDLMRLAIAASERAVTNGNLSFGATLAREW
jgi:hypothetical protein